MKRIGIYEPEGIRMKSESIDDENWNSQNNYCDFVNMICKLSE